jgi:hypothetical protein
MCNHVAKTTQGLKGQGAKKEVCFAHKILVFHFFSLFLFFCSWFCMMSPSM